MAPKLVAKKMLDERLPVVGGIPANPRVTVDTNAVSINAASSIGHASRIHVRHQLDQGKDNRKAGIPGLPLLHDGVSRLKPGCAELMSLADRMETLIDNVVHTSSRAGQAHQLVACLQSNVASHLDAETALLGCITRVDDAALTAAIVRAQAEHAAMRQHLIPPVIRGLRLIRGNRVPGRHANFVVDTIVLCEFLRLHARFKLETLYPLLARAMTDFG